MFKSEEVTTIVTTTEDIDKFLEEQENREYKDFESEDFSPVEYKVVETFTFSDDLEADLNELGAEGWDLVVWEGSKAIFKRF